jgi:predicted ArsR family transcriptional regulator
MAAEVAENARPRLEGKVGGERKAEVVRILNELGYEAAVTEDGGIEAVNCVFSHVALTSRAACRFDAVLLASLLGEDVAQVSCLADGEGCCRFDTT